MRNPVLLSVVCSLLAIGAQAQSFCPPQVAGYPFSGSWMMRTDAIGTANVQIARDGAGSTRCAIPQFGRSPAPVHLTDVPNAHEIFYGCASIVRDFRRGLSSACKGQSVTVRPYRPRRAQHFSSEDIERELQRLASTPPRTTTEGGLTVETHVIGQRAIAGILCVGFQETRQGTESMLERGVSTTQPVDRVREYWRSPVYGVLEESFTNRLKNVHQRSAYENLRLSEPAPDLLQLPPEYADTLEKALAASPQTVTVPEPASRSPNTTP